jgi:tRNA A22 N-methylase
MKITRLPERLQWILNQMQPGLPVWDIGCDHGYLGMSAWQSKYFASVHLVEKQSHAFQLLKTQLQPLESPPSLTLADATIQSLPLTGNIALCGMGGRTIRQILGFQRLVPHTQSTQLLIIAQSHDVELRAYLRDSGWRLHASAPFTEKLRTVYALALRAKGEYIPDVPDHGHKNCQH